MYVPALTLLPTLTVRVADPDPPEMVEVLNVAVGPVGETFELSVTVPVKPFVGEIDIVELPELPAWTARDVGLPAMLKSGALGDTTVTCTVA